MRFSVVGSVVVHGVVLFGVMRLAPAARERRSRIVTLEIEERRAAMKTAPPAEVARPRERATMRRSTTAAPPSPSASPREPVTVPAAPSPEAAAPSVLAMRGKVDLTLHSLPTVDVGAVIVAPAGARAPRPSAGDPILGRLDDERVDPYPLVVTKRGWIYKGTAFAATIHRDGTFSFSDKAIGVDKGVFRFDLTDVAMRSRGEDPYRHEKQKFLAHTVALRDRLVREADQRRRTQSLAELPDHLASIWFDVSKPVDARRAELHRLWREAATTDNELRESGNAARAIIEAFIRAHVPPAFWRLRVDAE